MLLEPVPIGLADAVKDDRNAHDGKAVEDALREILVGDRLRTFRPRPCTPIIEAMTTMPSAIMIVWLMPAMIVGIASGICTFHSFCEREEP